jgi:hypothetical protein
MEHRKDDGSARLRAVTVPATARSAFAQRLDTVLVPEFATHMLTPS